jgi:hypothetical protein
LVEFAAQGYMTAAQFLGWVVEHENVLPEEQRLRVEWMSEELAASKVTYGESDVNMSVVPCIPCSIHTVHYIIYMTIS